MRRPALVLLGFLMSFGVTAAKAQTPGAASKPATSAPESSVAPKPIHLPLFFEANRGQADSQVQFMARGKGYTLLLTPTETFLEESQTQVSARSGAFGPFQNQLIATKASHGSAIRMQLVGANSAPAMTGLEPLPGKVNYLIGNDPSKWQTQVPLYSQARTEQVYPGVDLLFHGDERQLEYDFVVAPGADPSKIAFRIGGAARMKINAHGDLVLHGTDSDFVMHKPVIYQTIAAERRPIEGTFVKKRKNEVAFRLGPYDHSQELVIDPAIGFSSFLGGAGEDVSSGFAIDDSTPGSPKLYLSGFTLDSASFSEPKTIIGSGTSLTPPVGSVGFVAKVDPTASGATSLIYLTFIGGSVANLSTQKNCLSEFIWLALDKSQGAANIEPVLGGETNCANFPSATVLNPVTDPSGTSQGVATIAVRLMPSGAAIDKAVSLGGNHDVGEGFVAVGTGGNVILSGETQATNLPTKNAYVNTFDNGVTPAPFDDCFVTVLNRADLSISYLTYLNVGAGSISGDGAGCGAFEDASGNILAGGNTPSTTAFNLGPGGATLANGFQTTFQGTKDTFAMKLNTSLVGVNQLLYATYFGGGGDTRAGNGSLDLGNGVVAIVGATTSNTANGDIPLKNAFQTTNSATGNGMVGFLVLLNTMQTGLASLQCGTYFGGTGGGDIVGAVTYDAGDPTNYRIILGGQTNSATDFPTLNPIQPYVGAVVSGKQSPDAFLSILRVPTPQQTAFNATLVFSTYIGGSNPPAQTPGVTPSLLETDRISAVAVDANHTVYAAGESNAPGGFFTNTNPTTTLNGFQTTCASCSATVPEDDVVVFSLGTGANATLQSIAVTPTTASIAVGQTQQFSAVGNYNDGTEKDITSLVTWTTVPTGFATMSTTSPGLAMGTAAGSTAVTPALGTATVLNTGALTVTAGTAATHFSVTGPGTATAGTAFNVTVTALDATNAVVTGYSGTVHFTSSDTQAVLPANSTLTNGTGTFSVTLKTAGAQTIAATDTVTATITGASGTITVTAAAPITLQVKTAGTAFGTVTDNLGQINCTQEGGANPAGNCTTQYPSGTQVTLTATTPGTGAFVGAPTACTGTGNTCQFTITATETVTATFTPGPGMFALTVVAGTPHTGGGTITSAPAGINCTLTGTTTSGTCTQNFPAGTLVTLTSAPGPGSGFFGWSGTTPTCLGSSSVSCLLNMSAATTATVEFTSGGGTVNVTVTGAGNVTDTANAGEINCTNTAGGTQTGTCSGGYTLGTGVTLTETPAAGATFSGWTGASCTNPTAATCSFQVINTTPIAVAATFAAGGGATTHFSVTAPATEPAGTMFSFTVTALTAANTTATGYTGTVHFTSSDGQAVLPANQALLNGVGTFQAVLHTAGAQTIAATDTVTASITGTSGTITVTGVGPSPALAITKTHTGNFTQGQHSAQYTVTVSNAANAAATSGTVTVTDTALSALAQDFAASFSGTSNPNGVWSYGQFVESTSTFTLFPGQNAASNTCNLPYWSGTGYPYVAANNSGSTVSCGTVTIPNDTLWMHPMNMAGTDSDVRFTAPASGTYEITGSFSALDTTTTLDSILVNGTSVFSTLICNPGNGETCAPTNTRAPFSVVKTLSAGNTVDFIVNCCSGPDQTFLFDSTGLSGAIDSNLTGLSLVSMFGTGWTCGPPNPANTCTRSDALAPGAAYPPITVLVNVGVNASSPQVNTVSVSGGGSATANASDSTVITAAPSAQLTITKTHAGNFTQGQQGAQYNLTVANSPGAAPTSGNATSATVQSTGSIYATGAGSTAPTMITLPSGATSVVFNSVTGSITTGCASTEGCIVLNNGTGNNANDPDGVGAAPATSSNTGTSSISGMTAPGAGYLVGLFVPAGGPAGAAPTALDFTSSGLGTSFTSLSPQLDQVFFIGDGLTGNGTGTQQTFNIPSGAGQLWLGISDAGFYNGAPGAYGDNLGTYTVGLIVNAPGSSAVTVTETAPSGLTLVSMAGTGWTCGGANPANVCTRSDVLAGGASYPVITVNVNVAADATSPQVNMAGVTGGGSAPANASDSTVIESASTAATHFSVTAPANATSGTAFNVTVTALTATNATATGYTGTVHFTSSDGVAVLPANSTLTNGVGTFQATLNTVGNQTITATDTVTATITGASGAINVSTAATVQLAVETAGTGTGTVTGNGINCASGSANACMASLPAGTQVVLTQAVTNGSTFAGWNGAPTMCTVAGATCTFTMPASAETVTATFTAAAATLKSIAVTPANPTEPINSSVQFTATGTYSDNSTKDITATVTWASSNTEAAMINAAGLVTVGGTAGLTTTISATLNEVTGSTLLTVSSSPISIAVTPPAGGTFPPVPPGGTLAIGIVLTSTPGFSGTVTFGCTTSSPTITCAPDPATVTLTPTGPTDVAIVLNTFCKGTTTAQFVPTPGGFGGGITLLLLGLTLGGVLWMWRRSPRWAVSFAILVLMAIGGASCASPPKGPNGATQPGNYSVTFSATVNGVTTSTAPIPFTVE